MVTGRRASSASFPSAVERDRRLAEHGLKLAQALTRLMAESQADGETVAMALAWMLADVSLQATERKPCALDEALEALTVQARTLALILSANKVSGTLQ